MTASPAIGQSLGTDRHRRFVIGDTNFGADHVSRLAHSTEVGHVVFVRSIVAHAELDGVDTAAAEAAPGVLAVVTAADVDAFPAGGFGPSLPARFAQPLLAEGRVRYVGEPIAAVVAATVEAAVDAAELVEVGYRRLAAVIDVDDAIDGNTLLFGPGTEPRLQPGVDPGPEPAAGNVVVEATSGAPFEIDADVVVGLRVDNPRMSPAPIEARVVTCAWSESDEGRGLTVWSTTQRPHGHRNELAALYGLDPDDIVVIAPDVGGGFGGKNSRTAEELVLPLLARRAGRTVAWTETRSEYLLGATQARGERIDFELLGTTDGRIVGLRADMVKDAGAYPITGAVLPGGYTAPMATGPYDIERVAFRSRSVVTNRVPTSAFRGAGRAPYVTGLERVIDIYAAEIGLDPAEVRRINLIRPESMPYTAVTGATYDEADYPGDLERALTLIGYEERRAEQAARRASGDAVQLGIGIGCYHHLTTGGGSEEASVTVLADGSARIITGTTTQGHGHDITWAQIAADVLGIDVDRIEVIEGRTDLIATGVGAVGSRSVQMAGMAVHNAATEVVERAKILAADLLEAAPGDVVLDVGEGGRFHVVGTPSRALTWTDVATETPTELSCGDRYTNDGKNTFPSGTHVAMVEVDIETGKVTVVRFAAVDDAGVRINPMLVDGQIHGGIAAGIGQALGELVHYDAEGTLRTPTFVEYQLATADELPSFELSGGETASSFNPLGVKGVGESGTIGATPAVQNAVVDALAPYGVDHVDLPCTAERVWAALRSAR